MRTIVDYLHKLIAHQVEDRGLVIWYDPESHYGRLIDELTIPQAIVVRYESSFFALRDAVEPFLDGQEVLRLVVYVPLDPAETHHALIELEAAGVVLKPGQQPPARNTRLSVVARNALKATGQWTDEEAEQVSRDVEAGKYRSVEEIEQIAVRRGQATGVLQLIFDTGDPIEVALRFLSDIGLDPRLEEKGAVPELAGLMHAEFEVSPDIAEPAAAYRVRLARHVMATDLLAGLQGDAPPSLGSVAVATQPKARAACVELARQWRNRRDVRESYVAHADLVARALEIARLSFTQAQLAQVETFRETEQALQRLVETALREQAATGLVELAEARQSSFWSEVLPALQAQWALIAVAGRVLIEADRVEAELKTIAPGFRAVWDAYTAGARPWFWLDTFHRRMERRYHDFDFDPAGQHEALEQLVVQARQRYTHATELSAEHFVRQYQAAQFQVAGFTRQGDIYARYVQPRLAEGKIAYVWVDALRYEMARELAAALGDEFEVDLQAAVGCVPTVTEVGMAALLPGAEHGAVVAGPGEGKLALDIDGTVIADRKGRVDFLRARAGVPVCEVKLEDLLPSPKKRTRQAIDEATLILVTSQEIDTLAEEDNVHLARTMMDDILRQLQRAFTLLARAGVGRIVVAADHGYLFGEELTSDMKIDAPGGRTVDLHRRVWVGQGGRADPSTLRARLADFGMGGDLEVAVPWNLACFKVRGGTKAYMHGGLAPQELVVPVMALTARRVAQPAAPVQIEWALIPSRPKISTRFYSVQVKGTVGLFDAPAPKVRVEIRAKGNVISKSVSASYGLEEATGDVQLRFGESETRAIEPNTITLMITTEPVQKTVSVYLLDATTGVELTRLDKIEIAIAI